MATHPDRRRCRAACPGRSLSPATSMSKAAAARGMRIRLDQNQIDRAPRSRHQWLERHDAGSCSTVADTSRKPARHRRPAERDRTSPQAGARPRCPPPWRPRHTSPHRPVSSTCRPVAGNLGQRDRKAPGPLRPPRRAASGRISSDRLGIAWFAFTHNYLPRRLVRHARRIGEFDFARRGRLRLQVAARLRPYRRRAAVRQETPPPSRTRCVPGRSQAPSGRWHPARPRRHRPGHRTPPRTRFISLGTVRSPIPISRKLWSISRQNRSKIC